MNTQAQQILRSRGTKKAKICELAALGFSTQEIANIVLWILKYPTWMCKYLAFVLKMCVICVFLWTIKNLRVYIVSGDRVVR